MHAQDHIIPLNLSFANLWIFWIRLTDWSMRYCDGSLDWCWCEERLNCLVLAWCWHVMSYIIPITWEMFQDNVKACNLDTITYYLFIKDSIQQVPGQQHYYSKRGTILLHLSKLQTQQGSHKQGINKLSSVSEEVLLLVSYQPCTTWFEWNQVRK